MAAAWHHAVSSARRWGGVPEDYLAVHSWFDESKHHHGDFRHRALRHHTLGVAECERAFGPTLTLSTGRVVPVRWVAERHVVEDCGFLPCLADWLKHLTAQPWMARARPLSRELDADPAAPPAPEPPPAEEAAA